MLTSTNTNLEFMSTKLDNIWEDMLLKLSDGEFLLKDKPTGLLPTPGHLNGE
jgi:hypothetical protein